MDRELYAELVLRCVERVPPGRVTTYGAIADVVRERLGAGGPRTVGTVMARHGGGVPWWRVVHADGSPPHCHDGSAVAHYRAEGTPVRPSGRLDLPAAFWDPEA